MMTFTLLDILKFLVLIAGIADAYKYRRQTEKILRKQSSKNISRVSVLLGIFNNIVLIVYCTVYNLWILTTIRLIALFTTCRLYWNMYKYYPYKTRGLDNFKRPPFFIFLKNSLTPNNRAKRL